MSKFYGIGVGPGDSSLLTLKAVDTIKKLDILYAPEGMKGKDSIALGIVKEFLQPHTKIKTRYFPMSFASKEKEVEWEAVAKEIEEDVKKGEEVGFVTLGDPMIYSTYVYVLKRLREKIEIQTIPGISSFSCIAASQNFPLVMDKEPLVIAPCTMPEEELKNLLYRHTNLVLMKVYKNFPQIVKQIKEANLLEYAILVCDGSKGTEQVFTNLEEEGIEDKISYFSTILINKNK